MRKSNGKWYVRFVLDGVEYSAPTGLAATERNRKKAEAMEARGRLLAQEGKWNQYRVKSRPFNEAADAFLEWAEGEYQKRHSFLRIRSSFTALRDFFGSAQMASIKPGKIEDFKTYRRQMEVKEVSIRHDLHNLSLMFQYAEKQGWVRENVVRKVKIPSDADAVRMNILSPASEVLYFETCRWMLKAAPFRPSPDPLAYGDLYDFGRLIIQQGCRPEELRELRKEDIDLFSRWLHIRSGKTKAARRRLKLTTESVDILARRMAKSGQFIFPAPADSGSFRVTFQRSHNSVLQATKKRPHALGFVHYDLRHTFATRAAMDGMPLPVLAAVLGHNSIRVVMKYVHITADNIDQETLRIEAARTAKIFAGFLPHTPVETGEQEEKPVNRIKGDFQS